MGSLKVVQLFSIIEPVACLAGLLLIISKKDLHRFKAVAGYLGVRLFSDLLFATLIYVPALSLSGKARYSMYFYTYWTSFLLEAILGFCIILGVYRLAMAPLQGLQRLGMLMFRWAAGIAVAVAVTMSFGPRVTGLVFAQRAITQLQQTESILTLCMLLFVCLAIRPMGLSYRSKIFGISLGLGVVATSDLVGSAWLAQVKAFSSAYNIITGAAILMTISIWIGYMALPEPKRRMIVLPTTSPFLRWNQISLALGDEPGFVAVGEVSPDMFAPAEVEVMRRASLKMRRLAN